MTKEQWLADQTPWNMIELGGPNQLRLFGCACVRSATTEAGELSEVLAVAEGVADQRVTTQEMNDFLAAIPMGRRDSLCEELLAPVFTKHNARRLARLRGGVRDQAAQADYLRDIINPYPVTVHPEWLTSTVVTLVRVVHETRDYGALPILADAVQEGGCEDEWLLSHLRSARPHVWGCWALDLLLRAGRPSAGVMSQCRTPDPRPHRSAEEG